jgi:hypothetical protein
MNKVGYRIKPIGKMKRVPVANQYSTQNDPISVNNSKTISKS